jgi:predicted nucleic acid-binding protein
MPRGPSKPRREEMMLVFIDTNILLDFYRIRSREAGLSILSKLEQNLASIITGDQVAMEFKKNRHNAILAGC